MMLNVEKLLLLFMVTMMTLYFNHPMSVEVVKERVEEVVSEGWRCERLRGVTKPSRAEY